jgi:diacylglycerol kinase family enzyme
MGMMKKVMAPLYLIGKNTIYSGKVFFLPVEMDEAERNEKNYADASQLPSCHPFGQNDGQNWKLIEDEFSVLMACNMPYVDEQMLMAPHVKIDEGALDLLLMRSVYNSRWDMLMTFMDVPKGEHLKRNTIECYKVKEFVLYPQSKEPSWLSLDGIVTPAVPIHVKLSSHKLKLL